MYASLLFTFFIVKMEIFMKCKMLELEWVSYRGHKAVAAIEHHNGLARRGMVTKNGALWLGRMTASLVRSLASESRIVTAASWGFKTFGAPES